MTEKTTKKYLFGLLYAVCIAVCVLVLRRSGGIFRTFALLFILPPVATLFQNQKRLTVLILALCGFTAARIDGENLRRALFWAVAAGLAATVGILIKRFLITARAGDRRRKISIAAAGVLAAAGLFLQYFLFGFPVGYVRAVSDARSYLRNTYAEKAPTVCDTFYDPFAFRYESALLFSDGGVRERARIYRDGTDFFDGYRAYYEARLLSQKREELTVLFAAQFPEYTFTVEGVSIETDRVIDCDSTVEELENEMTFSVTFYTLFADKAAYEKACRRISEAFPDEKLIFYAAEFQNTT